MKRVWIALVVLGIGLLMGLFSGCSKVEVPQGTPECIVDLAKELRNNPVSNPPASITRYTWNDTYYYYIPGGCCDIMSSLYDRDCNLICAPDGGWTGAGDGNCPAFNQEREDPVLIWQDERE